MRILRLYAPSLAGDHTLCYVHVNSEGRSCINEVPIEITYAAAGSDLSSESCGKRMTVVLSGETRPDDGDFLAVYGGDTLLRWNGRSDNFSVATPGFLSVSAKAEVWRPIRTAVLTVSDKSSRGERIDTAGPELERLVSAIGADVEGKKIVPDEKSVIEDSLKAWCDEGFDLILTTGGTGLSPRDVTPEALMAIAEKTVPGFGEVMRMKTLEFTDRAFLSRNLAVIRKSSLIIAFPGSRRGAGQCFDVIAPALRHAVETLTGRGGECGEQAAARRHRC